MKRYWQFLWETFCFQFDKLSTFVSFRLICFRFKQSFINFVYKEAILNEQWVYWKELRNWIFECALMYNISDNFGVASISEPCLLIGALVVGTCSVVRIPVDWPKIVNERSYLENLGQLWSFNINRKSSVKTIFSNFTLHFIS